MPVHSLPRPACAAAARSVQQRSRNRPACTGTAAEQRRDGAPRHRAHCAAQRRGASVRAHTVPQQCVQDALAGTYALT